MRTARLLLAVLCVSAGSGLAEPGAISFGRDIRPLLSRRCLACHGFDEEARRADLRLDTREGATAARPGGRAPAIIPGRAGRSLLLARVRSQDPGERMPPPESGPALRDEEIALLERWIAEGAVFEPHWAFQPVQRPTVPAGAHPVDHFVEARLARSGFDLAPPADPGTRLRRLSLDLRGLPPTPGELQAFTSDPAPEAWERVVDRLLASEHFGERLAEDWLDLARFADSTGYAADRTHEIWPWRDWVVDAINANMPFDRFTIEQLAGDLLPNPTLDQRIATGFSRFVTKRATLKPPKETSNLVETFQLLS